MLINKSRCSSTKKSKFVFKGVSSAGRKPCIERNGDGGRDVYILSITSKLQKNSLNFYVLILELNSSLTLNHTIELTCHGFHCLIREPIILLFLFLIYVKDLPRVSKNENFIYLQMMQASTMIVML